MFGLSVLQVTIVLLLNYKFPSCFANVYCGNGHESVLKPVLECMVSQYVYASSGQQLDL